MDEEIKAKPLIVNNIKTIISPTSDDIDFGVIRKCKPRKNKKRTESEQSQSTTEETSVSNTENHGLFSEFVQDEQPKTEPEEKPFIQFVNMGPPPKKEEPAPKPEPQLANNDSGKFKVIESNGLQIVQKKVKPKQKKSEQKPVHYEEAKPEIVVEHKPAQPAPRAPEP